MPLVIRFYVSTVLFFVIIIYHISRIFDYRHLAYTTSPHIYILFLKMNNYGRPLTDDELDTNIIDEYLRLPISQRTNDDFDNLLRTLQIVWTHKVYQDGLFHSQEVANRELYDLSMTLAQGLIIQDDGSKERMIKFKEKFKDQANKTISTSLLNNVEVVFTKKKLRQICMYYFDNEPMFFTPEDIIEGCPGQRHRFRYGEIIINRTDGEEVVAVREDRDTVEYVTEPMLSSVDNYILPKIGKKSSFESTQSSRRYIVDRQDVISLYNEYAIIFEQLN